MGIAVVLLVLLSLTGCPLFEPQPPVASFSVTPPSGAAVGDTIILNGTGSNDPQGNALTYQWSLVVPQGSMSFLSADSGPIVTFIPDKAGQYTAVLTVTTGSKSSNASKTITVTGATSGKAITSFGFTNPPAVGTINEFANPKTISVTVPSGTNVADLIATFTSNGASVKVNGATQTSGSTHNVFTSPVTYVVTASDTTTATYIVTVNVASASAAEITSFGFVNPRVTGMIINTAIAVTVPSGTNPAALVATFTTTGISVKVNNATQTSGTTQNDFTNPVTYVVTANDSTTVTYTVTVTTASSSDPIVGKWQLSTVTLNGLKMTASDIPMAMNTTISSDATWMAIGSQTGQQIFTYGTWTKQGTGNYLMTFAYGGPSGVPYMNMALSGGTLTGTFTDADGTMILEYIPGTAVIPDQIIGKWHLSSMDPEPSPPQSMNFTFNSINTWTMSGVTTGSLISASGNWSLSSPGKYLATFISGGPPGVPSMIFTLSNGTLTATFTSNQVQTTMQLDTGGVVLPDPIEGNWHLSSVTPTPSFTLAENYVFYSNTTWTLDGVMQGSSFSGNGTWSLSSPGKYTVTYISGGPPGVQSIDFSLSSGTLTATFLDNQQIQYTEKLDTGAVTLPAPSDPIVGTWSLYAKNGSLASSLSLAETVVFTTNGLYNYSGSDLSGPYTGFGHWNLISNYMFGDYTSGGNFTAVLSNNNQTLTVTSMTTPPDSWEYHRVP